MEWSISDILWLIILIILLVFVSFLIVPSFQKRRVLSERMGMIRGIERKRHSRVITMIHRQETMNFLGFPISRYIDIEDSELILRAIRITPDDMPIDLILHTPGGLVLASEQIACALKRHKGKVTVFVPHYAMSGGTMIALAAHEIVMDSDAVLGTVDPQLGSPQSGYYAAISIIKALEQPNPNRDDQTLILGDVAKKALAQIHQFVYSLVADKMPEEKARELAKALTSGQWTHDYPISYEKAKELGLPVVDTMPKEIYDLMDLFPQRGQRRPSVSFIPTPYPPPARTPRRGPEQ